MGGPYLCFTTVIIVVRVRANKTKKIRKMRNMCGIVYDSHFEMGELVVMYAQTGDNILKKHICCYCHLNHHHCKGRKLFGYGFAFGDKIYKQEIPAHFCTQKNAFHTIT